MKKQVFLFLAMLFAIALTVKAQSVGINTDNSLPNASALLDVSSTTKGFLAPRMTQGMRDLILSPAQGLLIFQTTAPVGFYYWNGTIWVNISNDQNLTNYVPKTTRVNGHALSSDVTVTKSDVGLSNVPNVDATNPSNITQDATHNFATETEKNTWNGKQNALGFTAVPDTRTVNGYALSSDVALTTADVAATTDKKYVTDAQQIVIQNTSGTNTGDNAANSNYSGLVTMTYPGAGIPLSSGSAWGTSITDNSANWNTAFGWGNHAGLYRTVSWVPAWGDISANPFAFVTPATNDLLKYNGTNWVNFTPNYISSYTETDPIVKAIVGIVKSDGSTISAATAGTDYLTPSGSAALLTGFPTLNQSTTGNAATVTTNANLTGDVTSSGSNATTIANKVTMTATNPISLTGSPTVIATNPVAISIAAATTGAAGSMSAADKIKLDAITGTNTGDQTNITGTSGNVTGIVLGANGGTGIANIGKIITLGGNLTTTGASAITLTSTGTTDVTLPTTGTLATLAGAESFINKTSIGIGTATPEFKLTLDGDGGIIAKGTFDALGSASLTTAGAGTRLIWYPYKSAFRAGTVDLSPGSDGLQWNDANLGSYSTAFGKNTIASGQMSTALGFFTSASGKMSTAIGYYTTAESYASVAIGRYNVGSASPNVDTWIPGDPLFEIGTGEDAAHKANALTVLKNGNVIVSQLKIIDGSQAAGKVLTSDADGLATWSTNGLSQWTTTGTNIYYNTGNVGIGTNSPLFKLTLDNDGGIFAKGTKSSGFNLTPGYEGAGTRLMWYPFKAAFRAGTVDATQWDENSIGFNTTALGYNTIASADYSTAIGNTTTASGLNSTALGRETQATGENSTAMGYMSVGSGLSSTAMGYNTTASEPYSTAMGFQTTASGENSTAFGDNTQASGKASTAMGSKTTASKWATVAMGDQTSAVEENSTAMGLSSTASGWVSTAMGMGTQATGFYSTAMGNTTTAVGEASVAMGQYNLGLSDALLEVGNGTDVSATSNAFSVLKDGTTTIGMCLNLPALTALPANPVNGTIFLSKDELDVNHLFIYANGVWNEIALTPATPTFAP